MLAVTPMLLGWWKAPGSLQVWKAMLQEIHGSKSSSRASVTEISLPCFMCCCIWLGHLSTVDCSLGEPQGLGMSLDQRLSLKGSQTGLGRRAQSKSYWCNCLPFHSAYRCAHTSPLST